MTGIVEFLTARLDEDEAAIKAMGVEGTGRWWVGQRFDGSLDPEGSTVFVDVRRSDGLGYIHLGTPGMFAGPTAIHVARHDPARVLAEVKAKRALLAQAAEMREVASATEAWSLNDYADGIERNLAAPYADHPDYDPAWRMT